MSKNALIGISSLARKIGKLYVGVGGYAHKVKKGYIGISGMARVFYTGDPVLIYENAVAGTYTLALSAGTYEITLIGGGGGASGRKCTTNTTYHYAQGGVGGTIQVTGWEMPNRKNAVLRFKSTETDMNIVGNNIYGAIKLTFTLTYQTETTNEH